MEARNLAIFLGLGGGDSDHGDDEEPVEGAEELPSGGFGRSQAAIDGSGRAGLLGVDEPALERHPGEPASRGDGAAGPDEAAAEAPSPRRGNGRERRERHLRRSRAEAELDVGFVAHGMNRVRKREGGDRVIAERFTILSIDC